MRHALGFHGGNGELDADLHTLAGVLGHARILNPVEKRLLALHRLTVAA
jgi:hypothetical protein